MPTDCSSSLPTSKATTPARTSSRTAARLDQIERTIVAIGSHDLILDLAASQLRARDPRVTLASGNVGSMGGLIALRDGLCHLAGSHLLDPDTGAYTLPYIDRILPAATIAVVRLVHREQGLLVAPGNPLGLAGVADLARPGLRYVNRQRGAGDARAARLRARPSGNRPGRDRRLRREEPTHLAVAAAIASTAPTAGWACSLPRARSASTSCPVTSEPYDLVLERETLEDPVLAPFWQLFSVPGVQVGGRAARRLRHHRDGPADPLSTGGSGRPAARTSVG